jgi:hypothetical protein
LCLDVDDGYRTIILNLGGGGDRGFKQDLFEVIP